MTPIAATEAERLERERFNKWSLGQFVLERDEKAAWRAWLARAMQQTSEPSMSELIAKHQVPKAAHMAALCAAPDRAPSTAQINTGAQMANVMFNLAQNPGHAVTEHEASLFNQLCKEWDAGRAPSTDSAADACWNPTNKELVSMVEDMRDAARYRALRDIKTTGMPIVHPPFEPEQGYVRDGLDCAIDAAIAASLPQTKDEPKPHERRRFER